MTQIKTSISLDSELLKAAREMKINISRACSEGLRSEVYDYRKFKEEQNKKKFAKFKKEIENKQ